jgi:hypothetical protein
VQGVGITAGPELFHSSEKQFDRIEAVHKLAPISLGLTKRFRGAPVQTQDFGTPSR